MKKFNYKPIFKFSRGTGDILCNKCRVIIKKGISIFDIKKEKDNLFCDTCGKELLENYINNFKVKKDDNPRKKLSQ